MLMGMGWAGLGWAGLGNVHQLVGEGLHHMGRAGRLVLGQLDQHHQPAGALDQGPHSAGISRALDQITLPVPWELAVLNLGRAQVDAQHLWDLPTPVLPLAARHSLVVCLAHAGDQLALEFAHGLGIDAVVDGFV
jgi:hypothetical protein